MKLRYILPIFFITIVCSAAYVEVTGDKVNLRSAAGMPSDVVGQVNKGDLLELQGSVADPWVKVTPPKSVDLWVSSQYVENGVVVGNRVRVRAGASVNYKDVGIIEKGTKVEVRGKVGDWTKIAPPSTTSVWITNAYVKAARQAEEPVKSQPAVKSQQPIEKKQPQVETKPEPASKLQPVVQAPVVVKQPPAVVKQPPAAKQPSAVAKQPPVAKNKPSSNVDESKKVRRTFFDTKKEKKDSLIGPAKVPQSKLRDDCNQAVTASYTGRLEVAPKNAPARFRLVRDVPGSRLTETECYIIGNATQLNSIKGQSFTFEGPVYWFKGTSVPTIYTQAIIKVR